jgi:hypothetical protein
MSKALGSRRFSLLTLREMGESFVEVSPTFSVSHPHMNLNVRFERAVST